MRIEGGTFIVPVLINDKITLDFTLDSGAAEVSVPLDVFLTLQRTNTISKQDMLEPATYVLADGSTSKQQRFRIRTLKVGDLELHDIAGSVAPVRGSLLLGQSFLSRVQTWSVDNQRHLLVFGEDSAKASPTTRSSVPPSPPQAGFRSETDSSCGAAQNLCRDGYASLCDSYRKDFRREGRTCPGVYEVSKATSAKHETPDGGQPLLGEYACGAARNVCRDGYSALCDSYRKDFQRAGRTCFGVTDSNP
jgi:hypothetical protein